MMEITLILSGAFIVWLAVSVVVAAIRVLQLWHGYFHWSELRMLDRQILVIVPSFMLLSYWMTYQRVNVVYRLIRDEWQTGLTYAPNNFHLVLGVSGACGLMWALLCAVFGEYGGTAMWKRFLVLGALASCTLLFMHWGSPDAKP